MTEDDSCILENQRREVDMEIGRRIEKEAEIIQWYEGRGMDREPELAAVRRMGVISEDGVHMTEEMCRSTPASICVSGWRRRKS